MTSNSNNESQNHLDSQEEEENQELEDQLERAQNYASQEGQDTSSDLHERLCTPEGRAVLGSPQPKKQLSQAILKTSSAMTPPTEEPDTENQPQNGERKARNPEIEKKAQKAEKRDSTQERLEIKQKRKAMKKRIKKIRKAEKLNESKLKNPQNGKKIDFLNFFIFSIFDFFEGCSEWLRLLDLVKTWRPRKERIEVDFRKEELKKLRN